MPRAPRRPPAGGSALTLSLTAFPAAGCRHRRAKAKDHACVTCGAITSSHVLAQTVVKVRVRCPECSLPLTLLAEARQCHKCWTAAEALKKEAGAVEVVPDARPA